MKRCASRWNPPSAPISRRSSDAAIDETDPDGKNGQRFWVTDGGAVENRGAVTLYLALDEALPRDVSPPPPLHIIIADASAGAGGYAESRGLHSVQGAGGQLGLALEGELLDGLKERYGALGSSNTVHEIAMPPVLRDGIGTHWLLPGSLTFTKPSAVRESATLSDADVNRLVLALHSTDAVPFDAPETAARVRDWAEDDPRSSHTRCWKALLASLSSTLTPATADDSCATRRATDVLALGTTPRG